MERAWNGKWWLPGQCADYWTGSRLKHTRKPHWRLDEVHVLNRRRERRRDFKDTESVRKRGTERVEEWDAFQTVELLLCSAMICQQTRPNQIRSDQTRPAQLLSQLALLCLKNNQQSTTPTRKWENHWLRFICFFVCYWWLFTLIITWKHLELRLFNWKGIEGYTP